MACPCAAPLLAVAGVMCSEGLRRATRCAGVGAAGARAELATAAAVLLFTVLYYLLPAELSMLPAAAAATCLLTWSNRRAAPAQRRRPRAPEGAYRSVRWSDAVADCPRTGDQYLVIGAGFFGSRLVRRLRERGERVRVLDICPDPFHESEGVDFRRGSAMNDAHLAAALAGVDCVFATFAAVRYMDRLDCQAAGTYRVNVTAMEQVIAACRAAGVRRLIQTSTSHVIAATGLTRPVMDESDPYVSREQSHNHYSWTKALSEQLVLRAADDDLLTCAVRPCSAIFGFNDRAVCDLMRGPVISMPHPAARTDYIYVDNVVLGHLKADARLSEGAAGVSGEAFCVSNEEPMTYEELGMAVQHYSPPRWSVRLPLPALLIWVGPRLLELVTWASSGKITFGSLNLGIDLFTPACLETAALDFYVSTDKARTRLNYRPCWTVDEGVQQMLAESEGRPDAKAVFALGEAPGAEAAPACSVPSETSSDAVTSEERTVLGESLTAEDADQS